MSNFCFVIMPFGGQFDDIYQKIYKPAIQSAGLEALRADDIYDNQPIIQDIKQSIKNATLILAEVTGRNPNVNYELGIAHGLEKEVIIVTSNPEDVPSDYRHLRYLRYHPGGIGWDRILSDDLTKTLHTVLGRLRKTRSEYRLKALTEAAYNLLPPCTEPPGFPREDDSAVIKSAKRFGYEYNSDPHAPSHAILRYRGNYVMLDSREGPVNEWDAAAACLLTEKMCRFENRLSPEHLLRMRKVFYDIYGSHGFSVDYLYDRDTLPRYTAREILKEIEDEFEGQIFTGTVRYLQENFEDDHFKPDSDSYYNSSAVVGGKSNAVCFRDGFYAADIIRAVPSKNGKNFFYLLDGLLPLSESEKYGIKSYVSGESHWLADWNRETPRFKGGETVRFRVTKVGKLSDWDHVSRARNVDFTAVN